VSGSAGRGGLARLDQRVIGDDLRNWLVFEPPTRLRLFLDEAACVGLREQAAQGFRSKSSDLAPLNLAWRKARAAGPPQPKAVVNHLGV
jgi:hypothetical protein